MKPNPHSQYNMVGRASLNRAFKELKHDAQRQVDKMQWRLNRAFKELKPAIWLLRLAISASV